MITHEALIQILHYDPDTGRFTWLVSTGGLASGREAGTPHSNGYRQIAINRKKYFSHRLAWFYVHKEWPSQEIDHISGVRNDNRLCNLRCVSHSQNTRNLRIPTNNTSGVVGVYYSQRDSLWIAQICVDREVKYLGSFQDKTKAIKARKDAECKYNFTVESANVVVRT